MDERLKKAIAMNISRKWLWIMLFLLFSGMGLFAHTPDSLSGVHFPDTLLIASEPDYPPYCFVNERGEAAGFSVDLFKAAAAAAGFQLKIKTGIWSNIKEDLASGRIDALPLVGRTPEREKEYDFTMPYLSLHGAVFVRRGTSNIHSINDLKGKTIVVMEGDNAEEYVKREKISDHIVSTKTFEEAFIALANGNHDAVITQRIMGIELLKTMGIRSVVPLDFHLPQYRQDFCFAVRKGDSLLLARLNEGLSIIIANNTYEEIRLKWFGPAYKEAISFLDVLRWLLIILVPLIILISLGAVVFLRREVRRQTKDLKREITERIEAERELNRLKNQLEETVAERTLQLQEKIEKLDKSEKSLLYMVEDLNQMTTALQEERKKLLASNQELEAFTYSVSHDLRAPLRAITGYGNFLLEDYAEKMDDEGKRFVAVIRKNAAKMDHLISDLLSLSRVSRSEMKPLKTDMAAIALSMYHEIASAEEKKLFKVTVSNMPEVVCDVTLIKQVWQNLIDNALKYSSRSAVKKIEIDAEEGDVEVIICIRDHGAGFDEQYQDKLFGVFQRLHQEDEFPGTGVGLAIVQRIIHRHGGRVWAKGEVGKGAAFYFSLPKK
jgi:signal transduction histidine kinase